MSIKSSKSDIIFNVFNYLFLSLIFIIILYPLIYIISCSFSSPTDVVSGNVWLLPVNPTLEGYVAVFENRQVFIGYANSVFYAIVGTIVNLVMTIMAAYPLSRKDRLRGHQTISFVFTFTMLFSGGMIPSYILVRNLGMLNTRWALIIPGAMSVWNVLITRNFFITTIPNELYEAAEIDSCGDFSSLFYITLPLSGTIIAVNILFYAVGHWNAYFNAMIYLRNKNLYPLQIVLRNILIKNEIDTSMITSIEDLTRREALKTLLKYSLIIVASVPVLTIYPFVQKHFVKGVLVGSIKG